MSDDAWAARQAARGRQQAAQAAQAGQSGQAAAMPVAAQPLAKQSSLLDPFGGTYASVPVGKSLAGGYGLSVMSSDAADGLTLASTTGANVGALNLGNNSEGAAARMIIA